MVLGGPERVVRSVREGEERMRLEGEEEGWEGWRERKEMEGKVVICSVCATMNNNNSRQ